MSPLLNAHASALHHTSTHLPPLQYALGSAPGDYVIITALSKDQLVWNVTYTTCPVVAPPLPLPFNASIHQRPRAGQADPQIGAVNDVQDLVLTVRRSTSGRLLGFCLDAGSESGMTIGCSRAVGAWWCHHKLCLCLLPTALSLAVCFESGGCSRAWGGRVTHLQGCIYRATYQSCLALSPEPLCL